MKITPLRLHGFHPTIFFRKLSSAERSPAYFTSGPWIVITWNPVRTWTGQSVSTLSHLKTSLPKIRRKTDLPFLGGAIGWVSYDAGRSAMRVASAHKKMSRIPEVCFHHYDSALLWNGKKLIAVGDTAFVRSIRSIHARPLLDQSLPPIAWKRNMSAQAYAQAFRRTMQGIRNGDFYQLNLTFPFTAKSRSDHRSLFAALLDANPASAASYIEHDSSAVVSASPERFVLIDGGTVTTCPIKGTRPRGRTPVEDRALMTDLLRSPKEQAELNMITDLLRNDIGKIAEPGSVRVRGYRLLQKNPSVWHTYSVIEGMLRRGLHPIDAFSSMSPPGSVTGCPKVAAMEEIDRLEVARRSLYCGSAVMLSANGRLDSTVLIRTIECDESRLSLGVGGGIVADSVMKGEEQEAEKKAERILTLPVRRTWINGREVYGDPRLKALDPSSSFARGLFETMLAVNGRIPELSSHLRRMTASARSLGYRIPSTAKMKVFLSRALALGGSGELRVKLLLSEDDVIVETRPSVRDPGHALGIGVSITRLTRAEPRYKLLPYHREWRAYQKARSQGFGETLLLNASGRIPEASVSNLFIVKKGILYTSGSGMLPGVARKRTLSIARKLGMTIVHCGLTMQDLRAADEVFLTRSLAGVIPVLRIGSRPVRAGKIGAVTRKLMRAFSATIPRDA